jgi:hypothetical protein
MRKIIAALSLLFSLGMWATSAAAQSWSPSGPIPRANHSATLDQKTNRMILFGGLPGDTFAQQNLDDVWRLTLVGATSLTWTRVRPVGPSPGGRFGSSAVYDSTSNRIIVFGGAKGRSSPCANDVWILTSANGNGGTPAWLQLSPSGTAPAPRTLHGAVYDPNTNSLIVYGGQDCFSTVFADVWVLSNANGVSGTPAWTQLAPIGAGPGPRAIAQSIAYDSTNNHLIIFGSGNQPSGRSNDVWVLSNANGSGGTPSWTQLSPAATLLPAARAANTATYDPSTNHLTIFGGSDSSGALLGDAWVLSNANGLGGTPQWSQLITGSIYFPEPRSGHTAVYNLSTNKMTVFGGQITSSAPSLSTNDVFILSHANGQ